MDYRSASTTMIWWHYSNGCKELCLPLTIAEISDIIYRVRELHILISVIITGGKLWKIRSIKTIHIQCKNWRKILKQIVSISIVCWEIFSELQGLLKCCRWAFWDSYEIRWCSIAAEILTKKYWQRQVSYMIKLPQQLKDSLYS